MLIYLMDNPNELVSSSSGIINIDDMYFYMKRKLSVSYNKTFIYILLLHFTDETKDGVSAIYSYKRGQREKKGK